jgi:hypothetical protein
MFIEQGTRFQLKLRETVLKESGDLWFQQLDFAREPYSGADDPELRWLVLPSRYVVVDDGDPRVRPGHYFGSFDEYRTGSLGHCLIESPKGSLGAILLLRKSLSLSPMESWVARFIMELSRGPNIQNLARHSPNWQSGEHELVVDSQSGIWRKRWQQWMQQNGGNATVRTMKLPNEDGAGWESAPIQDYRPHNLAFCSDYQSLTFLAGGRFPIAVAADALKAMMPKRELVINYD